MTALAPLREPLEAGFRGVLLKCSKSDGSRGASLSLTHCGTLIADEGRRMWLAFPTLFDFGTPPKVPDAFQPTCHIFYGMRVMDVDDGLPKWSAHENESTLL